MLSLAALALLPEIYLNGDCNQNSAQIRPIIFFQTFLPGSISERKVKFSYGGSGIQTMYYAQHADGQPTYQAPPVYLAPPVSRAPSLYGSHPQFHSQGSMPKQVIYSSGPSAATAPMNGMMRRPPAPPSAGSVVITSDGIVVQDFEGSQNLLIDVASYRPQDQKPFQRVDIVNVKASKILIINGFNGLAFSLERCSDLTVLIDQPPGADAATLKLSGVRHSQVVLCGMVPEATLTRCINVSIMGVRASLLAPLKTSNSFGIELHALDSAPGAVVTPEDILAASADCEVVLVPDGVAQVQQSDFGWHRYQHQLPQTGVGLLLDSPALGAPLSVIDVVPGVLPVCWWARVMRFEL